MSSDLQTLTVEQGVRAVVWLLCASPGRRAKGTILYALKCRGYVIYDHVWHRMLPGLRRAGLTYERGKWDGWVHPGAREIRDRFRQRKAERREEQQDFDDEHDRLMYELGLAYLDHGDSDTTRRIALQVQTMREAGPHRWARMQREARDAT